MDEKLKNENTVNVEVENENSKISARNSFISCGITAKLGNPNSAMDGIQRSDQGYGIISGVSIKKNFYRRGLDYFCKQLISPMKFDADKILPEKIENFLVKIGVSLTKLTGNVAINWNSIYNQYKDVILEYIAKDEKNTSSDKKSKVSVSENDEDTTKEEKTNDKGKPTYANIKKWVADFDIKQHLLEMFDDVPVFGTILTSSEAISIRGAMIIPAFTRSHNKACMSVDSTITSTSPSKIKKTSENGESENVSYSAIGGGQITRFLYFTPDIRINRKLAEMNKLTEKKANEIIFKYFLFGSEFSGSATKPTSEITHILKINFNEYYFIQSLGDSFTFKADVDDELITHVDQCHLDFTKLKIQVEKALSANKNMIYSVDVWFNPFFKISKEIKLNLFRIFSNENIMLREYNTYNETFEIISVPVANKMIAALDAEINPKKEETFVDDNTSKTI